MPRPRKPTEVLELTGAFRANPQRRRSVGAKSNKGLGNPPANLTPDEVSTWIEVVQNAPGGVLTSGDRILVETVARLLARFRADWLKGAEMALLLQCLVRLGWTPADRSKVTSIDQEQEKSPYAEFLQ